MITQFKIITSKVWLQTRITYWKFKLVSADILRG